MIELRRRYSGGVQEEWEAEYTRLEYIEIDNSKYKNVDFIIPLGKYILNPTISMELSYSGIAVDYCILFRIFPTYNFDSRVHKQYNLQGSTSLSNLRCICDSRTEGNDSGVYITNMITKDEWVKIDVDKANVTVNNTIFHSPQFGGDIADNYSIRFLTGICCKTKGFRIADEGTLVVNFIPVVRKSDGVKGFLETFGTINPETGDSFWTHGSILQS